jgi:hypothetical protein
MNGLLDSGANGLVIPLSIAKYLELRMEEAKPMQVVGTKVPRSTSKVSIILGRAGRYCDPITDVEVSVPQCDETPVLLGRKPVFELYDITFYESEHRFTMIPHLEQCNL